MTKKKRTWIFTLLALLIAALHISPFYIMINMSLKTLSDRSSRWMPALHPHFENYVTAMEHGNLMSAMWNGSVSAGKKSIQKESDHFDLYCGCYDGAAA